MSLEVPVRSRSRCLRQLPPSQRGLPLQPSSLTACRTTPALTPRTLTPAHERPAKVTAHAISNTLTQPAQDQHTPHSLASHASRRCHHTSQPCHSHHELHDSVTTIHSSPVRTTDCLLMPSGISSGRVLTYRLGVIPSPDPRRFWTEGGLDQPSSLRRSSSQQICLTPHIWNSIHSQLH